MKTRRILGVFVLVFAVVSVYTFINLDHDIRLAGAESSWYGYIFQNLSLAPLFAWIPVLAGLAVALAQFVPEMTNKRLKLTLHLPASETHIMCNMLLYGAVALLLLYAVFEVVMAVGMSFYFPSVLVGRMLCQHLPWLSAGIAAYGFTAWVCIEPQWKQRVWNVLIALAGLSVLFLSLVPGIYVHFGWGMAGIAVLALLFPLYSCARFKEGIQ